MRKKRTRRPTISGKTLYDWCKWLLEEQDGCCHLRIASTGRNYIAICAGWSDTGDGYEIAAEVAFQSERNIMQCDFGIDWEMPWNPETGDIMDTRVYICDGEGNGLTKSECAKAAADLNGMVTEAFRLLKDMEKAGQA